MVSFPVEKTIAFGGVAIGSIKAQLAPSTSGIVSNSIEKPNAILIVNTSGSNALTKAILLSNSVANTPSIAITINQNTNDVSPKP